MRGKWRGNDLFPPSFRALSLDPGKVHYPVTTLFSTDKPCKIPWQHCFQLTSPELPMRGKWRGNDLFPPSFRAFIARPWEDALSCDNTVFNWQAVHYPVTTLFPTDKPWITYEGKMAWKWVYFPLISCISTGPWNWNFFFPIRISQIYPLYADSESPSCTFSDML